PANKGTAAAVAYSALRIASRDPNAVLAFFPADHYYDDSLQFHAAVHCAVESARRDPSSLILLGAEPYYPETEYGWIQPSFDDTRVERFIEKPSLDQARELLRQRYLWNTFVMVGRAKTFLDILQDCVPHLLTLLGRIGALESRRARRLFNVLPEFDFSHNVLSTSTHRLRAHRLNNVRWSDLGKPERVMATLAEAGITPHWAPVLANKATA